MDEVTGRECLNGPTQDSTVRLMRRADSARFLVWRRFVYVSPLVLLVLVLQLIAAFICWVGPRVSDDGSVWSGVLDTGVSAFTAICFFQLANLALFRAPSAIRSAANLGLFILFAGLALHRASTGRAVDYFAIADNAALLSFRESWSVVLSRVPLIYWIVLSSVILVIVATAARTSVLSKWPSQRFYWPTLLGTLCLNLAMCATALHRHSDVLLLLRDAYEYHLHPYDFAVSSPTERYPYVKRVEHSNSAAGPRPPIFMIMMESCNANFIEAHTTDGREYTPFFNSLISQGVYIEHYYGNAIQTAPGQFVLLSAVLPSCRGKDFTDHPNLKLQALPEVLGKHGYDTLFFKAYNTLDIDNTGRFMRHLGFDEVHAMDSTFVSDADKKFTWGWGLQDDKTYQKVFKFLDARNSDNSGRPEFVVIHTVSHHTPFNYVPMDQRFLWPDGTRRQDHFANSMYLADKYLREFFAQLRQRPRYDDSIVIVVGDHGFPAGEHGNFYNEVGFYEENFRTPFLLIWKGKLLARRIKDVCFSHVDVAPTLLDLLQIHEDNHFVGQSILAPADRARAIQLIQPYDGTFLAVVKYPFKYVQGIRVSGEYLFDLSKDPHEWRNLVEKYRGTELYDGFKAEIRRICVNQRLLDEDRIWPGK
jgi:arylsulfatase A-like enzyme